MEGVGQLAGGIAHDFNNLLTVISGYAEIVLRRPGRDANESKEIGEIGKAADSAARLTRQLLAYSRKQVLEPRILDLNDVVAETQEMFGRVIGENIEVSNDARSQARRNQRRSGADRADHHEPGRERTRRDARGRPTPYRDRERHDRDRLRHEPRRLRLAHRRRHRARHGRRDGRADLRALLHDEGAARRHWARPLDRVRNRQAERRLHRSRQLPRNRHDVQALFPARGCRAGSGQSEGARRALTDRFGDRSLRRGRAGGPGARAE